MRRFLPLLSLPLLIGCSAASVLNGVTPSSTFDRDKNVSYGELDRQRYDLYRAAEPKVGAPVIVFVHGGSWSSGNKDMYKFVAEGFTKDGYTVAVPNYRLYPEARYPDMIVDTAQAVKAVGAQFPGRGIVLMGHSAGGYNALMAAMAPDVSGLDACSQLAGVVALSAPTGAYPLTDAPYTTIFPDRFGGQDAPMNRAVTRLPPMLIVNGLDDTTVGPENTRKLSAKLSEAGLRATPKLYDGMNHIDAVKVLSRHFDGDSPLKDDILGFIASLPVGPDYCAR